MGADMLVASVSTRKGQTIDFAAGRAAAQALTDTQGFTLDDPVNDIEVLLGSDFDADTHLTDDGKPTLAGAKLLAEAVITQLEESFAPRDVTMLEVAGRWMYLSGGPSWGDPPTDAAEAFWDLDKLPDAVLREMKIIVDEHSDPVIEVLNRAADDVVEAGGNDERMRDVVNLVVNLAHHYLSNPDDDMTAAIEASYDDSPDEVISWLQG